MTMELYGEQYNDMKGYRVVEGKESYNHYFGGEECNLPFCKLCGENMHQILCFDLKDERIAEIKSSELDISPYLRLFKIPSKITNSHFPFPYFVISNSKSCDKFPIVSCTLSISLRTTSCDTKSVPCPKCSCSCFAIVVLPLAELPLRMIKVDLSIG